MMLTTWQKEKCRLFLVSWAEFIKIMSMEQILQALVFSIAILTTVSLANQPP